MNVGEVVPPIPEGAETMRHDQRVIEAAMSPLLRSLPTATDVHHDAVEAALTAALTVVDNRGTPLLLLSWAEGLNDGHVISLGADGWTLRHSWSCRLSGDLFTCPFNDAANASALYDEHGVGEYPVDLDDGRLVLG